MYGSKFCNSSKTVVPLENKPVWGVTQSSTAACCCSCYRDGWMILKLWSMFHSSESELVSHEENNVTDDVTSFKRHCCFRMWVKEDSFCSCVSTTVSVTSVRGGLSLDVHTQPKYMCLCTVSTVPVHLLHMCQKSQPDAAGATEFY